jgi:hypothetical protein
MFARLALDVWIKRVVNDGLLKWRVGLGAVLGVREMRFMGVGLKIL